MANSDWIKMDTDLHEKGEVILLTESLTLKAFDPAKMLEDLIVGKLKHFWSWADRQAEIEEEDGVIYGATYAWVDKNLLGATGFCKAMEQAGWLYMRADGAMVLPRWAKHNGVTARAKAANAKRMACARGGLKRPAVNPEPAKKKSKAKEPEEVKEPELLPPLPEPSIPETVKEEKAKPPKATPPEFDLEIIEDWEKLSAVNKEVTGRDITLDQRRRYDLAEARKLFTIDELILGWRTYLTSESERFVKIRQAGKGISTFLSSDKVTSYIEMAKEEAAADRPVAKKPGPSALETLRQRMAQQRRSQV
jgi:hypothetical protein